MDDQERPIQRAEALKHPVLAGDPEAIRHAANEAGVPVEAIYPGNAGSLPFHASATPAP